MASHTKGSLYCTNQINVPFLAPFVAVSCMIRCEFMHVCNVLEKLFLFPSIALVLQELIDVFHANLVESAGKIYCGTHPK